MAQEDLVPNLQLLRTTQYREVRNPIEEWLTATIQMIRNGQTTLGVTLSTVGYALRSSWGLCSKAHGVVIGFAKPGQRRPPDGEEPRLTSLMRR
jgi:hypothetical protein